MEYSDVLSEVLNPTETTLLNELRNKVHQNIKRNIKMSSITKGEDLMDEDFLFVTKPVSKSDEYIPIGFPLYVGEDFRVSELKKEQPIIQAFPSSELEEVGVRYRTLNYLLEVINSFCIEQKFVISFVEDYYQIVLNIILESYNRETALFFKLMNTRDDGVINFLAFPFFPSESVDRRVLDIYRDIFLSIVHLTKNEIIPPGILDNVPEIFDSNYRITNPRGHFQKISRSVIPILRANISPPSERLNLLAKIQNYPNIDITPALRESIKYSPAPSYLLYKSYENWNVGSPPVYFKSPKFHGNYLNFVGSDGFHYYYSQLPDRIILTNNLEMIPSYNISRWYFDPTTKEFISLPMNQNDINSDDLVTNLTYNVRFSQPGIEPMLSAYLKTRFIELPKSFDFIQLMEEIELSTSANARVVFTLINEDERICMFISLWTTYAMLPIGLDVFLHNVVGQIEKWIKNGQS